MTTKQIADRLVALCQQGEFDAAQKELFAADAVSIEPYATPEFEKEVKGLDKIAEKGEKFMHMTETMHSVEISAPVIGGNAFAMSLKMDITMKGQDRMTIEELCVYQVKDGKIISEQFFM
ncbi:nuclear transport factor 2 family protein [Chitinophaga rhizophila]|uniref:Nuclear transport factor 2 family protein n=1 Tax=Chitinophaga rhizophila TaxID=2866212 RepID=A0ABS7GIN3_9BACT|nr:nuclear transport factor 2 family protein [Chitinophaga rhizophila]MBW8686639.1 nuclear transport factor 2 family protein [Chitinophaga rhizophila]